MFTRVLGVTLGLILAFFVTKAQYPDSWVVKAVANVQESIAR